MKKIKIILFSTTLLFVGLAACNGGASDGAKQGKEYTSAYICPMHCEGSGSDKEGKCPVCKMDYVKNEEHVDDEHNH